MGRLRGDLGVVAAWLPGRCFAADTPLTRLRRFEYRGRWYDRRLRVRVWKDRLPEASAVFGRGFDKGRITGFGTAELERFVAETRRAEWVHWANVGFGWTFLSLERLDRRRDHGALRAGHAPAVRCGQRYNRARFEYVLASRAEGKLSSRISGLR